MSKAKIEPKIYTEQALRQIMEGYIRARHNELARHEQQCKKRFYETFGEWKKRNSQHKLATMNYPEDEYVMVISDFKNYFDKRAASQVDDLLDDDDEIA